MKFYNIISKASLLLLAGAFSMTACTDSFEEVNTDPDRPNAELVPSTNTLAYCLRYASDNMFDEWFDLNECSGFAGQISKWSYTDEGHYLFRPTVNTSSWNICYYTIANLQSIIDKETDENNTNKIPNMAAAATIFQCQIFQIASDRWGNIPFTDALKLKDGVSKPTYDQQSTIYPALLSKLKSAIDMLNSNGGSLGKGDLLFKGDIGLWKKYANSLRLRIAARIANIAPDQAKAVFEEVGSDPSQFLSTNKENAFFAAWGDEYSEPWGAYYLDRPNEYGISKLLVDYLKKFNDPRLPVYAKQTTAFLAKEKGAIEYNGYQNGLSSSAIVKNYSGIGSRFMDSSVNTGFTPWLRSCESYFALAYAASKGWNVGITQEEAYKKAVTLSIEENDKVATDYLEAAGKYDGTLEQLFVQWWISVFKNGSEAWSVYRMSGYPQDNIVAPDSTYPGHNTPPMSYFYPDTERNLNTENAELYGKAEVDYLWGKQMWWDVRTGLK